MTPQELVERVVEVWNSNDPEVWMSLASPDVTLDGRQGLQVWGGFYDIFHAAISDNHIEITSSATQGDRIAYEVTGRGRHTGRLQTPELHAMDVFDDVVRSLTAQGIAVLLDNHNSNAEWCCSSTDGNALWYNAQYPESSWIADWQSMAVRYRDDPLVIGVDLRNEPRASAT